MCLKTLSINRGFCLKSFLIGTARELVKKTNVLSLWKSPSFGAEQRRGGWNRSEIWIKIELCTNYNNLQRFLVCRNDTCPGACCNYEAPGGVCPPLPTSPQGVTALHCAHTVYPMIAPPSDMSAMCDDVCQRCALFREGVNLWSPNQWWFCVHEVSDYSTMSPSLNNY